MRVVILGATGMLGSMGLNYISQDPSLQLRATARSQELIDSLRIRFPGVQWQVLDAERCNVKDIASVLKDAEWAVNAIGVIKPYIHDDNAAEVQRAVTVNALFPHLLARVAEQTGCRVLQIATDCVFSGVKGHYTEKDNHDPLDVYGKTKSLGEVYSPHIYHLRCSIIGPEPKGHVSLMDWFLKQPRSSGVSGYTNHQWNGVTTLHFARVCQGVIKNNLKLPHVHHLIPAGTISKAQLLECFRLEYERQDVTITPTEAKVVIDRTLATINESLNRQLWSAAGYAKPPSVSEMVAELAQFEHHFSQEMPR